VFGTRIGTHKFKVWILNSWIIPALYSLLFTRQPAKKNRRSGLL